MNTLRWVHFRINYVKNNGDILVYQIYLLKLLDNILK